MIELLLQEFHPYELLLFAGFLLVLFSRHMRHLR